MDRKQFMDELATALIKPWARQRIENVNISRSLRKQIIRVFKIPTQLEQFDKVAFANQHGKKLRCEDCSYHVDRKTRAKCVTCNKAVCVSHYYPTCEMCLTK